MAGGKWQITNTPSVNTAATANVTAGTTGGVAIRLCALQVSLGGTAVGAAQAVVRDGATGAGTIIWSGQLACSANGSSIIALAGLDLRATSGTLTIETTGAGGANTNLAVNAQGDIVPVGYPGFTP